jgi:endoglucanase
VRLFPRSGGALPGALAALAAALSLAACSSGDGEEPSTSAAAGAEGGSNPLAGQSFYVDPSSNAARQAARWRASGRADDAKAMSRLARRPTATWIVDEAAVTARVRALLQRARGAGRTALLVAYYIPGRDCGNYSAGGAASARAYRDWVRAYARGLGSGRAAVILEPDAIPHALQGCLSPAGRPERYRLLRFAARTLSARPRTSVYLDAGNAGWIRPSSRLVGPLREAGIGAAAGFALNVSNFYRTGTTVRYGRELSRRLGGAHFVIDTSRNGNGTPGNDIAGFNWCNPPGRALGRDPTTGTGQRRVDAYLWVKAPGESDGTCRGGPPAGEWWPEYALGLVRNAG